MSCYTCQLLAYMLPQGPKLSAINLFYTSHSNYRVEASYLAVPTTKFLILLLPPLTEKLFLLMIQLYSRKAVFCYECTSS